MVSKVTGYYTTDESYRNVGSNHLSRIAYNPNDLVLYIEFYNGAKYEYYGVPQKLYEGLMSASSHGVFFWGNIRQRFSYKLIEQFPNDSKKSQENIDNSAIINEILPENKKLDALDKQQQELDRLFKKNRMSYSEYERLSYVIDNKKQPLLKKLEKLGYFEELDNVSDTQPDTKLDKEPDIELDINFRTRLKNRIKTLIVKSFTKANIQSILLGICRTLWIITQLSFTAIRMLVKGYVMIMVAVFGIIGALMS